MGKLKPKKKLLSTTLLAFGIALCANDAKAIDFKVRGSGLLALARAQASFIPIKKC